MIWLLIAQLFTPAPLAQRHAETLMEGTWLSCPDDSDDGYSEKALDFATKGIPWFEVHYGPRDEFAVFAGNTPEHIAHDDDRNLLKPAYHFADVTTAAGGRNWSLARLGISLNVVRLDGSYSECYTFLIKLERDKRPQWAQP